jgi:Protein of unknown function (DUF789)
MHLQADIWNWYEEASLYGREIFTLGGTRGASLSYYVPFLSGMQLFVPETAPAAERRPGRLYRSDADLAPGWPPLMRLLVQFSERENPYSRPPLHEKLQAMARSKCADGQAGRLLLDTPLSQIHPASWCAPSSWYCDLCRSSRCCDLCRTHTWPLPRDGAPGRVHAASRTARWVMARDLAVAPRAGLRWRGTRRTASRTHRSTRAS